MGAARFTVTLHPSGQQFVASAQETLLQAAERAGVPLPSSCRNGTCRTCICLAQHGSVHYAIEWPGLSAEEKHAGWVLPCVAMVKGDVCLHY